MESETKLTAKLVKAFNLFPNSICFSIHGGGIFQAPGIPDTFVNTPRFTGWIEFKGPKTRLTPRQAFVVDRLDNAYVVRFMKVKARVWDFQVEDHEGQVLRKFSFKGTDTQVAAALLKELKDEASSSEA